MPQHQQLDVLRRRRPAEQHQPANQLDKRRGTAVAAPRPRSCRPNDSARPPQLNACFQSSGTPQAGWASGASSRGVVPLPGDEPAMPAEHRAWRGWEDLAPARTRYQPGQRGEPESVRRLVADRASQLPTKHSVLMPKHKQFRIPRRLTAEQHRRSGQHPCTAETRSPEHALSLGKMRCHAAVTTFERHTSGGVHHRYPGRPGAEGLRAPGRPGVQEDL